TIPNPGTLVILDFGLIGLIGQIAWRRHPHRALPSTKRPVVGLQDLTLEIGDEDGVGRVLDEALGVGARLVELAHVAQDADDADDLAGRAAQGGALRVVGMASPDALRGLSRTLRVTPRSTTSPRATMSSRIAETQELEDRLVRQQDLALEVGDEDGVRSV